MLAKTGKKTLMCDLLKFVPGACSPVTLHSVAAALKHCVLLLDVGPCSPSSASSDTSTPKLSGLPSHLASWNLDMTSPQFRPPSFQGEAFFRHALAELSPNFREKSYYIFTDRLYIFWFTKCPRPCWYHATNRIHYYLQCKIRHVYMNFRQNFSQKKKYFRHFRKKL